LEQVKDVHLLKPLAKDMGDATGDGTDEKEKQKKVCFFNPLSQGKEGVTLGDAIFGTVA